MNKSKKQRLIRAIPGGIVGMFVISFFTYAIVSDNKCDKLLKKENCITQKVFCIYSKKTYRGSGIEVSSGFCNPKDTTLIFVTDGFAKPIRKGLPIIVKYLPGNDRCYKFLWDSVFIHKGYRVSYSHIKNEGMVYNIEKVKN